jgi:hypothetical protein
VLVSGSRRAFGGMVVVWARASSAGGVGGEFGVESVPSSVGGSSRGVVDGGTASGSGRGRSCDGFPFAFFSVGSVRVGS